MSGKGTAPISMDSFSASGQPPKAFTIPNRLAQCQLPGIPDQASQSYPQLLENSQSWFLRKLWKSLRTQDCLAAEASRFEVIEFDEAGIKTCFRPSSSDEFRKVLDGPANSHVSHSAESVSDNVKAEAITSQKLRRIIVLEDVSRNYVAVLGSRLKIPPAFFATHLFERSVLDQLDDGRVGEGNIQSFALPFFQLCEAPKVSKSSPSQALEELYRVKANVPRFVAFPKPNGTSDLRGTVIEIESCLSYWSCTRDEHDWDVVILTDPPLQNEALSINTASSILIGAVCECSYIPNFAESCQLSEDHSCWPTLERHPRHESTFDDLSEYFQRASFSAPADPFCCSQRIREIALKGWKDFLQHAMHCLVMTKGEPYLDTTRYSSPIATLWAPTVEEWLLGRMVKWSPTPTRG